MVLGEEWSY